MQRSNQKLIVRKSRNGQGIFVGKVFKPKEVVYEIQGKRKHYTTLLAQGGTFLDNCFRISENYYLSPEGYIGVYQNHSCEPNAKVVKKNSKLYVVAINVIPKGAEVLIDYSTITASDDIWRMPCNCGTKSCRKTIRKFSSLPASLRNYYKNNKIVPQHIVAI